MKVYFSHGKESGPWGSKIKRLADIARERECEVDSVDYTDLTDPDLRVERLLSLLKDESDRFAPTGILPYWLRLPLVYLLCPKNPRTFPQGKLPILLPKISLLRASAFSNGCSAIFCIIERG